MSDASKSLRGSGEYATYQGRQYFADRLRDRIWLFSNEEPLPAGFSASAYDWVAGEKLVPMTAIHQLIAVETTSRWRGHEFRVGIVCGPMVDLFYRGTSFDEVSNYRVCSGLTNLKLLGRSQFQS